LAKSRIERAIGLLRKDHRSAPITVAQKRIAQIVRGGLAPWQARRVAAYIDEKLTSTIRVEDLAAQVSLTSEPSSACLWNDRSGTLQQGVRSTCRRDTKCVAPHAR
jgi:hypothetical protein